MNQAQLVLKNGAATPVDVIFTANRPYAGDTQPAQWVDRSAGTPIGYRRIDARLRRANGSPSTKLAFKVTLPKVGLDPVRGPVLINQILVEVNATIPDTTEEADRLHAVAFLSNMFKDPQLVDYFKTLSPAV